MGAQPHIAIQLLELHVGHAHTEEDPEFLSFLVLEKLLCALPHEPPPRPPDAHTAPGHQAGQQEEPVDKVGPEVGQLRNPVTIKSPSLPVEKEEGSARVSLHCHLCDFVTDELKPSKANQRLRSHQTSHHAKSVPPSSQSQELHSHPVHPSSCQLVHSQHVSPSSPIQEVYSQHFSEVPPAHHLPQVSPAQHFYEVPPVQQNPWLLTMVDTTTSETLILLPPPTSRRKLRH